MIILLYHGCARVAHCVTVRWHNFSHYCRPLRHYDVWFTCSEHREALPGALTTHDVHKQEFTVQGGSTSREASLRHSSGRGTWRVSPQYRDLRFALRQPKTICCRQKSPSVGLSSLHSPFLFMHLRSPSIQHLTVFLSSSPFQHPIQYLPWYSVLGHPF